MVGVISLFADMTHEGGRSIFGPFLSQLGASATIVGVAAGLGELIGYTLRFVSGRLADKTGRYWAIATFGYILNLLPVPLLALAGHWSVAVAFIFMERAGRALRTPPRDAMLSFAGSHIGSGWAFAVNEALDQAGATLGPLLVAALMFYPQRLSAELCLPDRSGAPLLGMRRSGAVFVPHPRDLNIPSPKLDTQGFERPFWFYLAGTACVAAGFADYPLIAYHFEKVSLVQRDLIPVFYAVAMLTDALAALVFGRMYDRKGNSVVILSILISIPFAPLVFLGNFTGALIGAVLWGIGMGAQESIFKAAVASMTPAERRGTAFGIFNMSFGIFWFVGSAILGILYDVSIPALVVFSILAQLLAVPLLFAMKKRHDA
ncbi:MAG: MFS transporter [Candidatus Moduliflexus flocculans]|nr:MFS transporter [Candidatus Moduliflexus flocculans]